MLVMISITVPLDKIDDLIKTFLKTAKPLPHVKVVGTYNWFDGEGKTIQIIEIEKGYEDEGSKELIKLLFQYRNIEGLKLKIQPVSTTEEVMAILGVTLPKR